MNVSLDWLRFFVAPHAVEPARSIIQALAPDEARLWTRFDAAGRMDVILSGSTLARLEDSVVSRFERLALAHKPTRIDIAVDFESRTFNARAEYDALRERFVNATIVESQTGFTVYTGSRRSRFFSRLYDKRAQIRARDGVDIGHDLLRFEVEAKRELAPRYLGLWVTGDAYAILSNARRRTGYEFLDAFTGPAVRLAISRRTIDACDFVRRYRRAVRAAYNADPAWFVRFVEEGIDD